MNHTEVKQGEIKRPFEAKVISIELRAKIEKFQKIIQAKRFQAKRLKTRF